MPRTNTLAYFCSTSVTMKTCYFTFFLAAITANCSHSTDPLTLRQRVECFTTVLELLANHRYLLTLIDNYGEKTQTNSDMYIVGIINS